MAANPASMVPLREAGRKKRVISPAKVHLAQQAALMRLQILVTGETHRLLKNYVDKSKAALLELAGSDGRLDGLGLATVRSTLERGWAQTFDRWKALLAAGRREAASIPFGMLALYHNQVVVKAVSRLQETHNVQDGVFTPQLQRILEAADRRVYQDGLVLSQRLWRLEHESLEGIQAVIFNGLANQRSAWDMALDLEQYLGANSRCPRWAHARLRLTKADIAAGNRTGLLSGADCAGQGVAYNALRLARNEIQIAHHLATDTLLESMPFVLHERVLLSPDHPKRDICDDVTSGGENGDGVYPKGEVHLPLHVQCLCFKTAVLMDEAAFTGRLRGWMQGTEAWAEMDAYAELVGGEIGQQIGGAVVGALVSWLWDETGALVSRIWNTED